MSHKKPKPVRRKLPRWVKVTTAALAAVTALTATTVNYGNHDSRVVTSGPTSCVVFTDKP
jgi:hypothetical protein